MAKNNNKKDSKILSLPEQLESVENNLVTAMLSGQRNLTVYLKLDANKESQQFDFELLPILKRDTRDKKESKARELAKELIEILIN
jgi:hypothetical protein